MDKMKLIAVRTKLALGFVACIALTACQTTTTVTTSSYQGEAAKDRAYNKNDIAKVRTDLAAQYIREGKLDVAMQQLEQAFGANSRYAPAYDMMGVLLQKEGSPSNLAKADGYFRRAIEIDPEFMQAYNNYGVYLAKVGKHKEAIAQFEIAGAALGYTGRTSALENLGISYERLGDTANAKQTFIKAIGTNRSAAIARVELINIYLKEGNSLKAKEVYDELDRLANGRILPAEVILQGIKIAIAQNNRTAQQKLSQELLSIYPLSDEAKRLKAWLANPKKPLS